MNGPKNLLAFLYEEVYQGGNYVDEFPEKGDYAYVYRDGGVDVDVPGDYMLIYTLVRTSETESLIKVVDKKVTVLPSSPAITLEGDDVVFLQPGDSFVDPGATTNIGTLNTIVPSGIGLYSGSYTIIYHGQYKGFSSFKTRTVVVGGGLAPTKPAVGLDISGINILKPAAGLDMLSIGLTVDAPVAGIDILTIDGVVVAPAGGLDISSIESVSVPAPALGLDISGVELPPLVGPTDIEILDYVPPVGPFELEASGNTLPYEGLSVTSVSEDGDPEMDEGIPVTSLHEDGDPEMDEGLELYSLGVDGVDNLPASSFEASITTGWVSGEVGQSAKISSETSVDAIAQDVTLVTIDYGYEETTSATLSWRFVLNTRTNSNAYRRFYSGKFSSTNSVTFQEILDLPGFVSDVRPILLNLDELSFAWLDIELFDGNSELIAISKYDGSTFQQYALYSGT